MNVVNGYCSENRLAFVVREAGSHTCFYVLFQYFVVPYRGAAVNRGPTHPMSWLLLEAVCGL